MNRPKYSIIIPTCERANLLEHTINGCLLQDYKDYEILVSNNYSSDHTPFVLDKFKDESRIRVVGTKRRLAMPNHWEFAMSHALGEYIIFLGDDDGISPGLLKLLDDIIELSGANIIKWEIVLYHHPDWPGVEANTLRINSKCSLNVYSVSTEKVIKDYVNFEFQYFPNLLQTCYRNALYKRAKQKTGKVFVGGPDFSCPLLLLMDSKTKYVHIDAVLGFGGRSKESNGAYLTSKDKSNAKRYKEFLAEFKNEDPFPYHEPKTVSFANIFMASFSYARHYYPEVIPDASINVLELCKRTQAEILRVRKKGTSSLIDKKQTKDFYQFVETLPGEQRNIIKSMAGYPSFRGKGKMIGKEIRDTGRNSVTSIGRIFPEKLRPKIKSIAFRLINRAVPVDQFIYLDGSKYGFVNGGDVMFKLNWLVELAQKYICHLPNVNHDGIDEIGRIEVIFGEKKDRKPKFIIKKSSVAVTKTSEV